MSQGRADAGQEVGWVWPGARLQVGLGVKREKEEEKVEEHFSGSEHEKVS